MTCRAVRAVRTRKLERPPAVVAATGIELRSVICEGEQVPFKKLLKAGPCSIELTFGLFEPSLHDQRVGKPPRDLRITARKGWPEEHLRVAGPVLACVDLRQVPARLHIAGQIRNRAPVPERGDLEVRDGHELSPQHAELKTDPRQRER